VTALREAIHRLGQPEAISWFVFWVTYAINVIIALISGFDAEALWWQRVVAATVGQISMFAFLLVFRFALPRNWTDFGRGAGTLIAFMIAGAIRGVSVSAAFIVMGPSGVEVLIPRLPAGIAFGLVVLVPVALVVVTLQSYRSTRTELVQRQEMLKVARLEIVEDLGQRDSRVEQQVQEAFAEAVSGELPPEEAAERLREFTTEVVRPLSHQLAGSTPTWELRGPTGVRGRITVRGVIDRGTSGAPFLPWATALTAALLSSSWFLWEEGLVAATIYLTGGVMGVVLGLTAANAVLARILPGRQLWVRIALVLLGALFAGVVFGIVATLLASSTPWIRALWAAGMLFYPVFALVLATVRATNAELRESIEQLREADDSLAWQVARLHQLQWVWQRTTARALHGPVQAMVAAAVSQLGTGADQRVILDDLRERLGAALDPIDDNQIVVSWRDALDRIEATWEGLCEVMVDIDDQARSALDADAVGADITMEIIAEAVSNAIRHGKARTVQIVVDHTGDLLQLKVINDGGAENSMSSGLGTAMLHDCSLRWHRGPVDGGFALTAALPIQR